MYDDATALHFKIQQIYSSGLLPRSRMTRMKNDDGLFLCYVLPGAYYSEFFVYYRPRFASLVDKRGG